ncbi:unnamed protein product [Thelazia callipaeda]|uniref:C2H2-type domain-containing protein n=1 Tax=Thelazia callipaeda TaxID=103827 RepID=A0A0N5CRY9_THECL|nr:unnamed protein product [Thelazia callipaeda]
MPHLESVVHHSQPVPDHPETVIHHLDSMRHHSGPVSRHLESLSSNQLLYQTEGITAKTEVEVLPETLVSSSSVSAPRLEDMVSAQHYSNSCPEARHGSTSAAQCSSFPSKHVVLLPFSQHVPSHPQYPVSRQEHSASVSQSLMPTTQYFALNQQYPESARHYPTPSQQSMGSASYYPLLGQQYFESAYPVSNQQDPVSAPDSPLPFSRYSQSNQQYSVPDREVTMQAPQHLVALNPQHPVPIPQYSGAVPQHSESFPRYLISDEMRPARIDSAPVSEYSSSNSDNDPMSVTKYSDSNPENSESSSSDLMLDPNPHNQVSDSQYSQSYSQYPIYNLQHPISGLQYPTQNLQHPISALQYPAQNLQHPISHTGHSVPPSHYLVPDQMTPSQMHLNLENYKLQDSASRFEHSVSASQISKTNQQYPTFASQSSVSFSQNPVSNCQYSGPGLQNPAPRPRYAEIVPQYSAYHWESTPQPQVSNPMIPTENEPDSANSISALVNSESSPTFPYAVLQRPYRIISNPFPLHGSTLTDPEPVPFTIPELSSVHTGPAPPVSAQNAQELFSMCIEPAQMNNETSSSNSNDSNIRCSSYKCPYCNKNFKMSYKLKAYVYLS